MTMTSDDLGVLGNLAVALGLFEPGGGPNPDWFGDPEASLATMLANDAQRDALVAFVDEAMGGADRDTDPNGVVWLPIVSLDDPHLEFSITIDDSKPAGVDIGIGVAFKTASPASTTTVSVPLVRARKQNGPPVPQPFLLGQTGGRIRIATSVTIDDGSPVPGQARLGSIGLDVDVPTKPSDPKQAVFGLSLGGLQLPGATSPRDLRVSADGADELDDALLDLVLSLITAQADALGAGTVLQAVAGLLGLRSGDTVPDFPITSIPTLGVHALAGWLEGIITTTASRQTWLGYLAELLEGNLQGDEVEFSLGGIATLHVGLHVDTGPTGNTRLTPTLRVELGDDDARVEVAASLFQVDLSTGAAVGLPSLGVWAAAGRAGSRVLDVANPIVARANTLRVGFGLDAQRRVNFVLAADGVTLGTHSYPSLDLTNPDAVMDAVGNTVGDIANELLGGFGTIVQTLLGLSAPAGIADVSITDLLSDPLGAVSGYWRSLIGNADRSLGNAVLAQLRTAIADNSQVVSAVQGTGRPDDPWRVALLGPLELEVIGDGDVLTVGLAATTRNDTLGERCTVIETRFAATIAELDLASGTASLVAGVGASLMARERGVDPPRATLMLGDGLSLTASGVGIQLGWAPGSGLSAGVAAPNLTLNAGSEVIPIAMPVIASDGSVTLPAEAWDGVEALVGYLAGLSDMLASITDVLGWTIAGPTLSAPQASGVRLRLADLVDDPATALGAWLPEVMLTELGPPALRFVADLFSGSGAARGLLAGTGHPDDPYRLAIDSALPNIAVWFPPEGLETREIPTPETLRSWRPGQPGLSPAALASALQQESALAVDVRQLIDGRDLVGGLTALAQRWTGSDGRILPPLAGSDATTGIEVERTGFAVGQLADQLDVEDLLGRIPTTTVHVALGPSAWPDAPAARRIDLSTPLLSAAMFVIPPGASGDWFVALGRRADCLPVAGSGDGTAEQTARLSRVIDGLASVSNDIAVIAVAGAGHAARLACQQQVAVTDLVLLGTPITPIALTSLTSQPTADAIRLLHRLAPVDVLDHGVDGEAAEDEDLALGRALVAAMIELIDQADPSAELRVATVPAPTPRAGLTVNAVFGAVSAEQVARAMTAVVAAGLADRARSRNDDELPPPTGVHAGIRMALATSPTGTVRVEGDALLTLFAYERATGIDTGQHLRVRLKVSDRLGWLAAGADAELRMLSVDLQVPLNGSAPGTCTLTLHDARVFGQSWERLVLGHGGVPVLPEARTLLAMAVQRLTADIAGSVSSATVHLLQALGLIAAEGGAVGDAFDQLTLDPGGLLRQRLASAGSDLGAAISELLGPLAPTVDLAGRSIAIDGGDDGSGRFGWHVQAVASAAGLSGQLRLGADAPTSPAGSMQVTVDLAPFAVNLHWRRPGGTVDQIAVWPQPDPLAIARAVAASAPSLGGHAALEVMRRADASVKPIVDAALDSLGLLAGTIGDVDRSIRPLVGLLADPAGWLRSSASLAAEPVRIQALFDALRPLLGVGGAPGDPISLANGVSLTVGAAGSGSRLELAVDSAGWTTPGGATERLSAGVTAAITVGASGPPSVALQLHVGFDSASPGRQAVHVELGTGGIEVFLLPAAGPAITLLPFAGLGSLANAAQAALPFVLDRLAEINGTVGDVVATVGDAMALRVALPTPHFDPQAISNWATNPLAALSAAANSITSTVLATIAPLIDDLIPTGVSATAAGGAITITVGDVSVSWTPATGVVALIGDGINVPGIDQISFTVAVSAAGLQDLSITAGPAQIDTGTVLLQPFVTVAAGANPAGGRRVMVGLAVDDTHRFAARWMIDAQQFGFVASNGEITVATDTTDPVQVALRVVEVIADLVAAVAMSTDAVGELLDAAVGGTTVRALLAGVLLEDVANPAALIDNLFDVSLVLGRVQRLVVNLGAAGLSVTFEGLTLTLLTIDGVVGLQLGLTERLALLSGDVSLWLENDDSWIEGNPTGDGGLFVGVLKAAPLAFHPVVVVNGVGLRIGKSSGPLLDVGITLESIAVHVFAELEPGGVRSGGVRLQFANLAVSTGGAQGENGIAQGIMNDSGPTPPQPAFSPSLAIQAHNGGAVQVSLRAGDGDGPWWIGIQKGFGPLYLEQIGFGVENPAGRLERISLLMDGSVSMFGLTCSVDDLQITYIVSDGDFFNPNNWSVDLAGLAVSADMAGLYIAGGLLKQTTDQGIEYLGMLLARFGVYGITIYGGYGEGIDTDGSKFTAFFAVGAINGPIGGPPAFFLTGIGGGFGINRKLVVPTDLSQFGNYPLIKALDVAAKPSNPMDELRGLGAAFPMEKGTFWFAAGISFNSFALVDGIAVLAVEIGDGLDINLLGLARMALPRPQVAIVSIELALLVRFSSSEGVLWVQGQLTDNSWLLYPDVKLTGGFAFVVWFKGEHAGEFVITLGGYHPDFKRSGYPVVPRLGLRWGIGDYIVIKAGSYFALTSEAVMAGGDFEASASFGPAWAEVLFGAHGIVYFDPFRYQVDVYARISAGVTIDTWIFGEITISISIGARIQVKGPDFYGKATFEVGPIELEVEFGSTEQTKKELISATAFIAKYLDTAPEGGALAHTLMTSFGALPAKGEDSTPDGSSGRPFVVVVEFGLTFTSTVPATELRHDQGASTVTKAFNPSKSLGVAPMGATNVKPQITLEWQRNGVKAPFPFVVNARPFGRFPVGVWGPPQDDNNRKVPKAEMIEALNELELVALATESPGGPPIPYYQVEIGLRRPLPFLRRNIDIATLKLQSKEISALLVGPTTVTQAFSAATTFLTGTATPTALASLRGERQSPPLLGTLAEGLDVDALTVKPGIGTRPARPDYDHFVDAPVAVGLLSGATVDVRATTPAHTTVKDSTRLWRVAAPSLASVDNDRSRSIAARLVVTELAAVTTRAAGSNTRKGTLIAATAVPPSATARAATAIVATSGGPASDQLRAFSTGMTAKGSSAQRRAGAADAGNQGSTLLAGQTVILRMPSADRDAGDGRRPVLRVRNAPARVVLLGHGGSVLFDGTVGDRRIKAATSVEIAQGTERIIVIGQGGGDALRPASEVVVPVTGLAGWHAGLQMPYAGWSSGVGPGCVVRSFGEPIAAHGQRRDAGWVSGAELATGLSTVTTRFSELLTTVVVVLDDPAAFGDIVDGRRLVLGLDGADRATDAAGVELPPVLLTTENRSILAYDIVPDRSSRIAKPVVVTIASELGWSLAGVMGSAALTATAAAALVTERGLDAALRPFAAASSGTSEIVWRGTTRTDRQRRAARLGTPARPTRKGAR